LFVHEIDGDNTGRATARRAQSIKTDLNRALMEFSVLTQRESELQLPPSIDCREIDLYIKGRIFRFCQYCVHISIIHYYFQPLNGLQQRF
jgi:hypothetical protein